MLPLRLGAGQVAMYDYGCMDEGSSSRLRAFVGDGETMIWNDRLVLSEELHRNPVSPASLAPRFTTARLRRSPHRAELFVELSCSTSRTCAACPSYGTSAETSFASAAGAAAALRRTVDKR